MKNCITLNAKDKKKWKCIEINYEEWNYIKKFQMYVPNVGQ